MPYVRSHIVRENDKKNGQQMRRHFVPRSKAPVAVRDKNREKQARLFFRFFLRTYYGFLWKPSKMTY